MIVIVYWHLGTYVSHLGFWALMWAKIKIQGGSYPKFVCKDQCKLHAKIGAFVQICRIKSLSYLTKTTQNTDTCSASRNATSQNI